jgi:hypothetical protein
MEEFRRRTGWPGVDDEELLGWAATQPTRKSGDTQVATGTGAGRFGGLRRAADGEQL